MSARLSGDAGQVAGIESVAFGLVVLLVGTIVVAHTWAVVDAKFLAAQAAREATRAFVESSEASEALDASRSASDAVVQTSGRHHADVQVHVLSASFERCARVRVETHTGVQGFSVPWRPDRPAIDVGSVHEEVIDPFRDGPEGSASCERP